MLNGAKRQIMMEFPKKFIFPASMLSKIASKNEHVNF